MRPWCHLLTPMGLVSNNINVVIRSCSARYRRPNRRDPIIRFQPLTKPHIDVLSRTCLLTDPERAGSILPQSLTNYQSVHDGIGAPENGGGLFLLYSNLSPTIKYFERARSEPGEPNELGERSEILSPPASSPRLVRGPRRRYHLRPTLGLRHQILRRMTQRSTHRRQMVWTGVGTSEGLGYGEEGRAVQQAKVATLIHANDASVSREGGGCQNASSR